MNLRTGVDVWKIPSAIHDFSFDVKLSKGVLIPVTWIDKGARILAGSDTGQVQIWNTVTKTSLPALPHRESLHCYHHDHKLTSLQLSRSSVQ